MNADTEFINVAWKMGVWNENGDIKKDNTWEYKFTRTASFGGLASNISKEDTHLTCVLQITCWNETKK